ncbi:hemolysin family protein [Shewanella sp. MBTL60-007]|uniref:hemolysin family protein n=1 Tax=Shewanella sp. MBTL60-007 TaxID=2815911 RepID=UPI001BBBCDBA|nr:hemolysin family protein [Shewanella sp. MBTL60-007]GIU26127.1 membrane protein [Shewanella sp. MBTL60-007]
MDIAILFVLILINGVFAMSEIALMTAKKSRLQKLAAEGSHAAAKAIKLAEEPTQFLSTVQIGITVIGILNGILGQAALAGPISELIISLGFPATLALTISTASTVVVITYVSIVIGELVPKRIAQFHAERISTLVAPLISFLASISRPFVFLLSVSTDALLRLLGRSSKDATSITEDDIHALLDEGSEQGVIEKQEHSMVRKIFQLDDRKVVSLMTPRSELVYFDTEQSWDENLPRLLRSDYSIFPVTRGGMDNILGFTTARFLLKAAHQEHKIKYLMRNLLPCLTILENTFGSQLLELLKTTGEEIALVVDEYGDAQGIVTQKDLLEALAGEFKSANPNDSWAKQISAAEWIFDGAIPVTVLKENLNLTSLPEEKEADYQTLTGMFMWLTSNVPTVGDKLKYQDWSFEVLSIDNNKASKVRATLNKS